MANSGPNTNASQFYITTRSDDLEYLDGKHTLFGEVAEGFDVLDKINELYVDSDYRPYHDVRILHTHVLDDPFPDPPLLQIPPSSPTRERPEQETVEVRLAASEILAASEGRDMENDGRTEAEIEQALRAKEAKSRAVVLEMIGDLPDADVKPPEEVLFVCKLNPVTESSDLDMAFCRFGQCKSQVIRDSKTGDSLCFAFVEFTDARHCEEAYFKMNNVLLDDRRIKVDFSQSVSKLWNKVARRGERVSKRDVGDDGRASKSSATHDRLFGKKRASAPLRLKADARRAPGDDFDLVDDHESSRRSSTSSRREHRRERSPEPSSRRRDRSKPRDRKSRSRSREGTRHRKRSASPDARRRDDRRDSHKRRSPSRERTRDRRRSSSRDRKRSRSRDRARR